MKLKRNSPCPRCGTSLREAEFSIHRNTLLCLQCRMKFARVESWLFIPLGIATGPLFTIAFPMRMLGRLLGKGFLGFREYSLPSLTALIPVIMAIIFAVWILMLFLASQFLARFKPLELPVCRRCGYDLRASKHTCPECGEAIPRGLPNTTTHRDLQGKS